MKKKKILINETSYNKKKALNQHFFSQCMDFTKFMICGLEVCPLVVTKEIHPVPALLCSAVLSTTWSTD